METLDYIGKPIKLTTVDRSEISGELCRIDEREGRIVLKDVIIDQKSKMYGPQTFFVSDIQQIECVPDDFDKKKKSEFIRNGNMKLDKLVKRKYTPQHIKKLNRSNMDTDDLVTAKYYNLEGSDGEANDETDSDSYEDFYQDGNITIISRVTDKFREAIGYIMEQELVAVTFQGIDIGRKGILSLIQIATETDVIVFDILRMGEEAFEEGLHQVFQSNKVQKIIHDCRWFSDMLYHKYKITLRNVFDTQVANAYVYSLCHGGDWPRHVDSLPGCLITHLNLSNDQVFSDKVRERNQQKDQEIWLRRPMSDVQLQLSCKNVSHMIKLHKTLQNKMLLTFRVGVNLYLDSVKDVPLQSADKYKANRHLLPSSFLDIPKYVDFEVSNSADFDYQRKEQHFVSYDQKGFRANYVQTHSNHAVVRSHDSIWHKPNDYYKGFTQRPKNGNQEYTNGMPAEEARFCKKIIEPIASPTKSEKLDSDIKEHQKSYGPASDDNLDHLKEADEGKIKRLHSADGRSLIQNSVFYKPGGSLSAIEELKTNGVTHSLNSDLHDYNDTELDGLDDRTSQLQSQLVGCRQKLFRLLRSNAEESQRDKEMIERNRNDKDYSSGSDDPYKSSDETRNEKKQIALENIRKLKERHKGNVSQ